jgi:hypothetical protein
VALLAGLQTLAGFLGQQLLEAQQLLLQGQGAMGIPALQLFWAVAIQPGLPPAPQPAAEERVGERSRKRTVV